MRIAYIGSPLFLLLSDVVDVAEMTQARNLQ